MHSYHAQPRNPEHSIGTSDYIQTFSSAIARDNLVAFQFHPEKSQGAGLRLLANFAQWDGTA